MTPRREAMWWVLVIAFVALLLLAFGLSGVVMMT